MNQLFIIQLATSFIAGSTAITLLTFIAEKVSSRIAGVVVSFPLAIAIALFFMGWTLSPQAVADVAPLIPLVTGATLMFVVVYVYIALLPLPKYLSIISSFAGALFTWLLLAAPLARFEFNNYPLALLGYIALALVAHYWLAVKPNVPELPAVAGYTLLQKLGRALFVGFVMTLVVFLSKTVGLFWGGIFSSFPAAYSSTLLILHRQYNAQFLFRTAKMMPIGTVPMVVYGQLAALTFPNLGIGWATVVSYLGAGSIFCVLLVMAKKINFFKNQPLNQAVKQGLEEIKDARSELTADFRVAQTDSLTE